MTTPNPGSDEARKQGCTCPRMDNSYGKGYMGNPDVFVYREGCPLHWGEAFTSLDQIRQEEPDEHADR